MASSKSIISLLEEINYNDTQVLNIFVKYKLVERYKTDVKYYQELIVAEGDRWDLLSYRNYGTTELWWLIAIFNNVVDPFETMQVGQILTIIQPEYLQEVLLALRRAQRENI